jgi:hypothetical protein
MKKTVLGVVTMCAGAPLLALGVGTATGWADTTAPSTGPSDAEQPADGGLAISFGGISLWHSGNSTADSFGPSLAVAYNNSNASARGVGNLAIATNNSGAGAIGALNTSIADNYSGAGNFLGTGNGTNARNNSTAVVGPGDFNSVSASNTGTASAIGYWNSVTANNVSTADVAGIGNFVTVNDGSTATVRGNANLVTASCGGSVTLSAQSNKIVTSAPCLGG